MNRSSPLAVRRPDLPARSLPTNRRPGTAGRAGFTLTEILIATTILAIASTMTMAVFIATMRRAQHTDDALKGTTELRYAADIITQAVRSAALPPTVADSGLTLLVPPRDLGFATVEETTWLDAAKTVKGSKDNQRMLHVSDITSPAVVRSAWKSESRPAGAINNTAIGTYFVDATSLPTTDLNSLFKVGDTLNIPATTFGPAISGVINSISNSKGNKTLTLTNNLGVDVPNGTKLLATAGKRIMFKVMPGTASDANSGELRYYPDRDDLTRYTVLARFVSPAPLVNPAAATGTATVPFVIDASSPQYVTINLQKIPAGSAAGRTIQGIQTTAFTRNEGTNP